VPGRPNVVLEPAVPMVVVKPRRPMLRLALRFPRLMRSPGAIRMDRRKFQPIFSVYPFPAKYYNVLAAPVRGDVS
jgi:hypothetical protein